MSLFDSHQRSPPNKVFDEKHKPGAVTPLSGIYRCVNCQCEIVHTHEKPLPSTERSISTRRFVVRRDGNFAGSRKETTYPGRSNARVIKVYVPRPPGSREEG